MSELNLNGAEKERRASAQVRLEAIFYGVTALSSASYIAYVLAFSAFVQSALGSEHKDLTLLILAFSMLTEAIFETPTGALADRYGHHRAVFWSFLALASHAAIYLIAIVFFSHGDGVSVNWVALGLVILSEIFLAIGTAFQSGSLNSWFTTSMQHEGYGGLLHPFMGKRRLTTNLVWLVVGTFILLLEGHDTIMFITAFSVGTILYVVAAIVTRKMVTAVEPKKTDRLSVSLFNGLVRNELFGAMWVIIRNRKLLIVALTHSVFWTLAVTLTYFWKDIVGPLPRKVDGSLGWEFAIIWLMITSARVLGAGLAGRVSHTHEGKRDPRISGFIIGQVAIGLPLIFVITLAQTRWQYLMFTALLLAVSRVGQEFSKPITMAWIHEETKSNHFRASVESLVEGAAGIVIVILAAPILLIGQTTQFAGQKVNLLTVVIIVLSCLTILFNVPLIWLIRNAAPSSEAGSIGGSTPERKEAPKPF